MDKINTDPAAQLSVAQPAPHANAHGMTLSSAEFQNGDIMPQEQVDCGGGGNLSPSLTWSGAPAETVSYLLTAYDPDAPTGSGFWHWATYNIPASTTHFAKGAGSGSFDLPAAVVQARNDGGGVGYTGPCPPEGDAPHRYIFTLYALSITLEVPASASAANVCFNARTAVLAKTSITALYGR